jgi:phosphatidylglycerophosphate synthase
MNSWSNRLSRPLVRPLIGTGVTPNHLTTLRLLVGLGTFALLAIGEPRWTWWAGWSWILTVFLDYADGELARMGNMATPGGHDYDYAVDVTVNSGFFLFVGIGLRNSSLHEFGIALGVVACVGILLASLWSEAIVKLKGEGSKAYGGKFGFNFDDMLYLLGPLAWLDWLRPTLYAAAAAGVILMSLTRWRLWQMRRDLVSSAKAQPPSEG